MEIAGRTIAVCDWSLRGRSVAQTVQQVEALGLKHVHLALSPLVRDEGLRGRDAIAEWKASGLGFTAGMIGFEGEDYTSIASIRRTGGFAPDAEWGGRRHWIELCLRVACELGIRMISSHIGFVPRNTERGYSAMVGRVRDVADLFAERQCDLLMETGQEPASELLHFIGDVGRPNIAVNFDPANMILYGAGDPLEAIRMLGQHIRHVHIKDAIPSEHPAVEWGREVPFGAGQAQANRLVESLSVLEYKNALAIEREGGDNRTEDVRSAIRCLEQAFCRPIA